MSPMTPLRAYALSITPRQVPLSLLTTPAAVPACRECGGRTYKGRLLCIKCERRSRPLLTPEERSRRAREAARARWGDRPRTVKPERPPRIPATKISACGGGCGKRIQVRADQESAPVCHACRRADLKRLPRACDLCGEQYVPVPKASGRPPQRWCSKSCARAWQNGARPPYQRNALAGMPRKRQLDRIRRQRRRETWDGVSDEEIFERDRWRCGICGKRIGKSFKYPDGRSRSIDHIVPLSEGGGDTAANKRAAHLGCNRRRMNRGGGEQLVLVG